MEGPKCQYLSYVTSFVVDSFSRYKFTVLFMESIGGARWVSAGQRGASALLLVVPAL